MLGEFIWMLASLGQQEVPIEGSFLPLAERDIHLNLQVQPAQTQHDITLLIDHEARTLTIRAWFVAGHNHHKEHKQLQAAIDFWNGVSNRFVYRVGRGKESVDYRIIFDLEIPEGVYNEQGYFLPVMPLHASALTAIEVVPDMHFQRLPIDHSKHKLIGYAQAPAIYISEPYADNVLIGIHEVGHRLGAGHAYMSVMAPKMDQIWKRIKRKNISEILRYAGLPVKSGPTGKGFANVQERGPQPDHFWDSGRVRRSTHTP